jgi:lipopolysaccharide transport system permease protein
MSAALPLRPGDPPLSDPPPTPAPSMMTGHDRRWGDRLRELWAYRHLVQSLVVRDLKVRYKNSVLGFFWSLVSPLLMMLVFWVVFGFFMGQTAIKAYQVFVLVAILPWNWFSTSVAGGINSIVGNAALINKVYFPREVLPISIVLSELANFLLAVPVLLLITVLSGIPLTVHALWLPVIIAIQALFTVGIVLWLSTANVYYRDTAMIMDVVLLAWFFLTPIVYPMTNLATVMVPIGGTEVSAMRLAYIFNPMASLISSYRVVLYGSPEGPPAQPDLLFLGRTAVTALVILAIGYAVFLRHSGRFGEEV